MANIVSHLGRLLGRRPTTALLASGRPPLAPDDTKASAAGRLIALQSLGQPVWTPRDYTAFAREGFMQNPVVYRCVRMISEAAASVPLLLYDGDVEIEQHPVLDLVARPNPLQSTADLLESWYGYLLVSGNAYLEAVSLTGAVRELYALRSDRMKIVPGADGWPAVYEYAIAGQTVRYVEDVAVGRRPILHLSLFHPLSDHYGMSPIEAAASAIDLHNAASAWNKALLDNSARPSGALVYAAREGRMTMEQFQRLKSELEESFEGARNAGRPMLLEGGLDWKSMSLSPKDMDFLEAKSTAAREIALALGVPPMLLGIPGDNTYANYQEAREDPARPSSSVLIRRSIAMALVPLGGPAHEPIFLAEAKAHLRVSGTSEDLLIASLITAARVHLELILSCGFITQTWSWFLDDWPRRIHLDLPLGPARSVTAIRVLATGGVVTTLPASSYVLSRSSPPRLTLADRQPWSRGAPGPAAGASGIEIEMVAGFGDHAADVPQPIRHAILLLVARWYEQRVPVDVGRDAADLPPEIAALIAPYRQVRI